MSCDCMLVGYQLGISWVYSLGTCIIIINKNTNENEQNNKFRVHVNNINKKIKHGPTTI